VRKEGWEVLNAVASPVVDHVGNANDLSQFPENTFTQLYASHVVEHLDYNGELQKTLAGWLRVLEPCGTVMISVPDLDVLARLFVMRDKLSLDERFQVMRMMFGGHIDQWDYHVTGLNGELLASFLRQAGFADIRRVETFGIFDDTSGKLFKGVRISLNMTAVKPGSGAGGETSRRLGPLQGKTAFKLSGSFKMTDEEPLQS